VSAVLYTIAGLRDFRPSIFGKANTLAQVAAVIFVMLAEVDQSHWVAVLRKGFLQATFVLTIISALHYLYLVAQRLDELDRASAN
jgi:cardiolipin synthase